MSDFTEAIFLYRSHINILKDKKKILLANKQNTDQMNQTDKTLIQFPLVSFSVYIK